MVLSLTFCVDLVLPCTANCVCDLGNGSVGEIVERVSIGVMFLSDFDRFIFYARYCLFIFLGVLLCCFVLRVILSTTNEWLESGMGKTR